MRGAAVQQEIDIQWQFQLKYKTKQLVSCTNRWVGRYMLCLFIALVHELYSGGRRAMRSEEGGAGGTSSGIVYS